MALHSKLQAMQRGAALSGQSTRVNTMWLCCDRRLSCHQQSAGGCRQRACCQGQLDKVRRQAAAEAKAARVKHSQDLAQNAALLAQLNALRKVGHAGSPTAQGWPGQMRRSLRNCCAVMNMLK